MLHKWSAYYLVNIKESIDSGSEDEVWPVE